MDESKVLAFIKQLSNDTAREKVLWQRLNDYQNRVESHTTELSLMLAENEYRHIDYHNSYVAIVKPGDIFILYENNESGRDNGICSIGYKIYLQSDIDGKIVHLPCPSHALYQLLNAIQTSISKKEAEAESFINQYLSQN